MNNKALVVSDLQNDITKNYKEIIETTNQAIDSASQSVCRNEDIQTGHSRSRVCSGTENRIRSHFHQNKE